MQVIRSVISLFLLLVYSISFAHDLIPHCHFDKMSEHIVAEQGESHHHHEHHTHEADEETDHEHITHQNHLDDGLLDYVICLLSELEHPSEYAHRHYAPVISNDNFLKGLDKPKFVAILFTVFTAPEIDMLPSRYATELAFTYHSPPLLNSPHRGPPSISC